jgi:hypothetical protein
MFLAMTLNNISWLLWYHLVLFQAGEQGTEMIDLTRGIIQVPPLLCAIEIAHDRIPLEALYTGSLMYDRQRPHLYYGGENQSWAIAIAITLFPLSVTKGQIVINA